MPKHPDRISGVSVILGWSHREGGQIHGHYSQADVVDVYGERLKEELEYENVRVSHIETRKNPVKTEEQKLAEVPDSFVPILLSCGWHDKPRKYNMSLVEYSGPYYKLASIIADSVAEWGKCMVFGHKTSLPVAVEGSGFIRITPFALNGPQADDYMLRLEQLGISIGRVIGEYLRSRKEGLIR